MRTIIEMAREAGIEVTYDPTETPTRAFAECWIEDLEHFAALVRADEREAERPWVGLTDEEWLSLGCKSVEEVRIGLAIEAKLKEKNNAV